MQNNENEHGYDDIIKLPHHVSATRPHMKNADRAAQFAPFAALTGHDAAVKETARLTTDKLELDESTKAVLDEKLRFLQDNTDEMPVAIFTYFVPDEKKSGGAYVSHSGVLKKIDTFEQVVTLYDGTEFPIDSLSQIDGDMFSAEDWI